MTVLVPDPGRFEDVESQLREGLLTRLLDDREGGSRQRIELGLPKFELRSQSPLTGPLQALGLRDAFSPTAADLRRIAGSGNLVVDRVVHEATLEVDEEGSVAAAATGIGIVAVCACPDPEPLIIDRPFVVAIQDDATGALLFLGRVTDP